MPRTDVHAESSPDFDPQLYELLGVWDLRPDYPAPEMVQERMQTIRRLVDQGYRSGHGGFGQCGHCGAEIRYGALMVRHDVKEWIWVGETCLDNRFELAKDEFHRLREEARLNRERKTTNERKQQILVDHPLIVWLTYIDNLPYGVRFMAGQFFDDMAVAFKRGKMTDRQVSAVEDGIVRDTDRLDSIAEKRRKDDELAASGIAAPEGRVDVEGTIVSIKEYDNGWNVAWKMLVVTDPGWKVWATAPMGLREWAHRQDGDPMMALKDRRVRFRATLSRGNDDDPLFAIGKSPDRGEVLEGAMNG